MNTPRFGEEREIVDRFLRLLGYSDFLLRDPNAEQGLETGADVGDIGWSPIWDPGHDASSRRGSELIP
jgi:hypothetical protein